MRPRCRAIWSLVFASSSARLRSPPRAYCARMSSSSTSKCAASSRAPRPNRTFFGNFPTLGMTHRRMSPARMTAEGSSMRARLPPAPSAPAGISTTRCVRFGTLLRVIAWGGIERKEHEERKGKGKRKKDKGNSGGPRDAETEAGVRVAGRVGDAVGGTQVVADVGPRAAAQHAVRADRGARRIRRGA